MLIFSNLGICKYFVEITHYEDSKSIMADSYAFICIDNCEKLESYFLLGLELKKQEIEYAVLLGKEANFAINEFNSTSKYPHYTHKNYPSAQNLPTNQMSYLPLNLIILLFSQLGASFCLIDKRNFSLLPFAQSLVNHYLLDIKILALVESYKDIQNCGFWRPIVSDFCQDLQHMVIGIDGIVEKNLLKYKNPCS